MAVVADGRAPAVALGALLRQAVTGTEPARLGEVHVLGAPPGPADAVLGFTGWHVVAAPVAPELVRERLPDGDLGVPLRAGFLAWLAGQLGTPAGSLDLLLTAEPLPGPPPLELRPAPGGPAGSAPAAGSQAPASPAEAGRPPDGHPRVARAKGYRSDLRVHTTPDGAGLVLLGRGLAGRLEIAFEVEPAARGRGLGRALVRSARHLAPPGEPLFAQVAPANAASLRALLAAGFRPLGAEVLFRRGQRTGVT